MTPAETSSEYGFTLVELLVALFIFALMSVAGVALLRSSVDGQAALTARLADHGAFMRAANLMEADLAQAMPRPVRNHDGNRVSAFSTDPFSTNVGTDDGTGTLLFALTRSGLSAGGGATSPDIGRIAYYFGNDILGRTTWPHPDGTGQPTHVNLWENIQSIRIRFRTQNGAWRDEWTPVNPHAMPRAIEMTVRLRDNGDIILVMPVGGLVQPETDIAGPGKV